jgi:hypothetical protein
MKYVFKINGIPADKHYNALPFGRQIEFRAQIEAFKASAKHIHFSCKRTTTAKGVTEFKKLYRPTEWFLIDRDARNYHDDSFEVWYKVGAE